jgi:hypothetical protein
LEKVSPELRPLLAGDAAKAAATRLEVLLAQTPPEDDESWDRPLRAAVPGIVIEGRVGGLVTAVAPPAAAAALAALPEVAGVRLPRVAHAKLYPSEIVEGWEPLKAGGLARLHQMNCNGKGTRVAVVDADFRGWEGLVGKRLPEGTRFVDLTAARNSDLRPDAEPAGEGLGHGVHVALAVLRAAPEADLTLVRIDPAAPYMLQAVARAVNAEPALTYSLRQRLGELDASHETLERRRDELQKERKEAMAGFADETQKDFLLGKKKRGLALTADEQAVLDAIERKEAYQKRQADWDADEKEYEARTSRHFRLEKGLQDLRGVRTVASALAWDEGQPADGSSALSRYFDEKPFRAALWFQSAGDTRGQAWSGLFRDEDGDGAMEFAPPGPSATQPTWPRELNYLAWRHDADKEARELPKEARLRLSLQWRESHDPEVAGGKGPDPYLRPLADLRIVVLRQIDPDGAKRPADDFEVVAESAGPPMRLEATPTSATYELTVELPPQLAPGRYAVRIEGRAPDGTRPRGYPTIPGERRTFELRPRLFLETLEGGGRAVFATFPTEAGVLGVPADSRGVVVVGAADAKGEREPYSTVGTPYAVELLRKPDVLAYDEVETGPGAVRGPGVATGFAAGAAAAAFGGVVPRCNWLRDLGVAPGGLLRVPDDWPRR